LKILVKTTSLHHVYYVYCMGQRQTVIKKIVDYCKYQTIYRKLIFIVIIIIEVELQIILIIMLYKSYYNSN